MSAFAILVAALLPAAIGAAPALWLRGRPTVWTVVSDSLLWGLLLISAIAWLPPLQTVGFDAWLFVCMGIAIASIVAAIFLRGKMASLPFMSLPSPRVLLYLATATGFFIYLIICLTRPGVDWDAINYYLLAAVDFVTANHVGWLFSHHVTIAGHAPNEVPPLVPLWYGQAIGIAAILHANASDVVRLIPFVLLIGSWAAIRRLALAAQLEPTYADGAALLFLLLPAVVNQMTTFALYVDGAMVFVFIALVAELATNDDSAAKYARIGALCTLALLAKISGPVLVVFLLIAVLAGKQRRRVAVALIGLTCAVLIAVAAVVGDFGGDLSIGRYVAIAAAAAFSLLAASSFRATPSFRMPAVMLALIGAIPGALYLWKLSHLLGSPAGYYVASWAHVASPNFGWALRALRAADVYGWNRQLGLPEHYGIGLLLWWGLAPLTNALAVAGAALAIRRGSAVAGLALIVALFYVAWLSVLNLIDFRHLLPAMALLPVLAAYFIRAVLAPSESRCHWAFLGILVCSAPFMWVGQWPYSGFPNRFLSRYSLDPGHVMTTQGLLMTGLFVVGVAVAYVAGRSIHVSAPMASSAAPSFVLALLGIIALVVLTLPWMAAALLVTAAALELARRFPARFKRSATVAAFVGAVVLGFEPVAATAVTPGLPADSGTTRAQYYFAYYPALEEVARRQSSGTIFTFAGYGVSWYTVGRLRRIDLADALDLGILRPDLASTYAQDSLRALGRNGATWGILPAASSAVGGEFINLMRAASLPGMNTLLDATLTTQVRRGAWTLVRANPSSFGPSGLRAQLGVQSAGRDIDLTVQPNLAKAPRATGLVVRLYGGSEVASVTIHVEGTYAPDQKFFEYAQSSSKPAQPLVIAFTDIATNVARDDAADSVPAFLSIQSVIVTLTNARRKTIGILSWHSPSFDVQAGIAHTWAVLPGDSAFAIRADLAPLNFIGTSSARDAADDYSVFPGMQTLGSVAPQVDNIDISLGSSPVCTAGKPLKILLSGTRVITRADGSQDAAKRIAVKAVGRSAGMLRVPVEAFFDPAFSPDEQQNAIIEEIAVGPGPSCPVLQLVRGKLHLQRNRGVATIGYQTSGFVTLGLTTPDPFRWSRSAPLVQAR